MFLSISELIGPSSSSLQNSKTYSSAPLPLISGAHSWGCVARTYRQLSDMKMTIDVEHMSKQDWIEYVGLCGWALARAHARTGDAARIAGHLGKNDTFDQQSRNSLLRMPIRLSVTTRNLVQPSALDDFRLIPTSEPSRERL